MTIKPTPYLLCLSIAMPFAISSCNPDSKPTNVTEQNRPGKSQDPNDPKKTPLDDKKKPNPPDTGNTRDSIGWFEGEGGAGGLSWKHKYDMAHHSNDKIKPPEGKLTLRLSERPLDRSSDSSPSILQDSTWIATDGLLSNGFAMELTFSKDGVSLQLGCKFLDASLTAFSPAIMKAAYRGNKIDLPGFEVKITHPDGKSYCDLKSETPYLEFELKERKLILKTAKGSTFAILEKVK